MGSLINIGILLNYYGVEQACDFMCSVWFLVKTGLEKGDSGDCILQWWEGCTKQQFWGLTSLSPTPRELAGMEQPPQ